MKRRFPLHVHISILFIALILLVGAIIGGLGHKNSRTILETTSSQLSKHIGREIQNEFTNIVAPAEMAIRLLSFDDIAQAASLDERLTKLGFMREMLNSSHALASLFIGYSNGDFFLVHRVRNATERKRYDAPNQAAYVVQSIEHRGNSSRGRFIFLDSMLTPLRSDDRTDYATAYDPRARDWFEAAQVATGQVRIPPHFFFTTHNFGVTIANRTSKGSAVVGADILLETLDRSLAEQKATPDSHVVLTDQWGQIVAYENPAKSVRLTDDPDGKPAMVNIADLGIPVLAKLAPRLPEINGVTAQDLSLVAAGKEWHISVHRVSLECSSPLFLITAIPENELMAATYTLMHHALIAVVLVILLAIPVSWGLARRVSTPLRQLAKEAEAIRNFDFLQPITIESQALEVHELAQTMDRMKQTIRRFLDINTAISEETDFSLLLPHLLSEMLSAAEAEAGLLYLADHKKLRMAAGLRSNGAALPASVPLFDPLTAGPRLGASLGNGTAQAVPLEQEDIRALGLGDVLKAIESRHAIAVPLFNRRHILVGLLVLLQHGESDTAHLRFIESLSGAAAVSLENKELILAQKQLFEAFIKLIAGAIDAKSPYTGAHCARVPELTKILAHAACAETSGPYKDFQLTAEEWEALHLAAWLHDCGKVTTPEHIVDKATKLETLYDRLHEIRMRFEVLKRDAEIACLKSIAAGEPVAAARQQLAETLLQLAETLLQLDEDFAFVASCNEGSEFMAEEKLARLKTIAQRTWTRTLDDRIGLSRDEKARKARTPPPTLPVTEPLLADKPEHRFERRAQDRIPADNPWGIRMPAPELRYNHGELHNLAIARGTLTEEERYKINEHIVQTMIMLNELPFPKHLRNVPEIVAGHHEKMDGTGYPRQLRKEQMSPAARMMAIADIFEALTAGDRPYKKGKTLSETIRIMWHMKEEQHIDPELFDLFLRSGVYRDYAERFMKPEQIDAVDLTGILNNSGVTNT